MELRHLRNFIVTAERGSVTGAAAHLYMTQPALSRQLRELERHVGGALFTRHARGIRLTHAGSRLLAEARTLVAQADRLVELAADQADDDAETLTVGLLDEGAAELTSPLLAGLAAGHPRARIVARSVAWGPHVRELRAGVLDAVIGPRFAADDDEFCVLPLFSDGRVAVLASTDPLAEAEQVHLRDLVERRPPEAKGLPQAVLDHFLLADLRGGEGPSQDLSQAFLMADGLALIARGGSFLTVTCATERFYRHPGVVFRPLTDAALTETVILTRAQRLAPPLVQALLTLAPLVARALIGLVPGAIPAVGDDV